MWWVWGAGWGTIFSAGADFRFSKPKCEISIFFIRRVSGVSGGRAVWLAAFQLINFSSACPPSPPTNTNRHMPFVQRQSINLNSSCICSLSKLATATTTTKGHYNRNKLIMANSTTITIDFGHFGMPHAHSVQSPSNIIDQKIIPWRSHARQTVFRSHQMFALV